MVSSIMGYDRFKICHVNCQSLMAHFDEFSMFFERSRYHVICLSETWLNPKIPDSMIRLPGYYLVRNDRIERQGGGVALYIFRTRSDRKH